MTHGLFSDTTNDALAESLLESADMLYVDFGEEEAYVAVCADIMRESARRLRGLTGHATDVCREVEAIAGERASEDAYWAGFAAACEEIEARLKLGGTGDA